MTAVSRFRRRASLAVASVVTLLAAAACGTTSPSVLPSTTPRIISSVAYAAAAPAGTAGHLLDLYLPADVRRSAPVIVWSSGNGWLDDNGAAGAGQIASMFNPHGYAVAGVDIRSSSQAVFPAQLSDIKAAVRFLRANAARYHLDGDRIGVAGDSSGGWAAVMAAVTADVPGLEGHVGVRGPSSRVRAAAAFYPPTNFLQPDRDMIGDCMPFDQMLGVDQCASGPGSPISRMLGCPVRSCPDIAAAADPVRYIDATDPPLLLVHGQQDVVVPWQQSLRLYRAVQQASGQATLVLVPHGQHGQANAFLTDPGLDAGAQAQTVDRGRQESPVPAYLSPDYLLRFFDRNLGRP